jgi:glutamate-1-semialdehyde 2,1-aminomutase
LFELSEIRAGLKRRLRMTREKIIKDTTKKYEDIYMKRTPKSRAALDTAAKVLPGGDSRITTFFYPYPLFIDKGNGCRITDLDSNEYIDFHNCYTALIHGHGYPKIVEALREMVGRLAVAVGAPTTLITELAGVLCRRVSSVERVRFCNSGTEAVMLAIRAARAFSGRNKILKIEGGYNGAYDTVVHPPNDLGLPKSVETDQLSFPFNNKKTAEKAIIENKKQLACVIAEGMMGAAGQIPPKDGFLQHLRKVSQENDVLMILDEVMTFRLDYGGIQHLYGIKPDLTVFGKIIGGGIAAGGWGGRQDIMELYDPIKGQTLIKDSPGLPAMARLFHGGTFNANPLMAVAGRITLEDLTANKIARINQLGELLATGIRKIFAKLNIKAQITGMGSLQNLHFTPQPIVDFKTAQTSRKELMHLVHMGLLERGIFLPARGLFSVSTPMTNKEINIAIEAVNDVMAELKPVVEQAWPELMD